MTAQTPAERRNPKNEDSRMIITDTTTPEAGDTISRALQRAYLAGFNAAGEGYNGEYPFSDSGRCPSSDEDWITGRDMVIEKLIAAIPSPQNGESLLSEMDAPNPSDDVAHPDDYAVARFAALMKAKLAAKRAEGRGGWNGPDCNADILSSMLRAHVEKGDPLDVGNFAMMLHQRGERITATPAQSEPVGGYMGAMAVLHQGMRELAQKPATPAPVSAGVELDKLRDRTPPPASAVEGGGK